MSALPSWARVGAKVVCINCRRMPFSQVFVELEVGQVYHIRETLLHSTTERYAVRLEEFQSNDVCFWIGRFRPLISQADDLETNFLHLLDAPLNHEREEA